MIDHKTGASVESLGLQASGILECRSRASSFPPQIPQYLLLPPLWFTLPMAVPGPYSGVSTLAFVGRASAFAFGVVYGSIKLSYLKAKAKSHKKEAAKAKAKEEKGHH